MVKVKICCIASRDEARLAIASGADALGLVSSMPSGPGVIGEATISEITQAVATSASTFLLTSLQSVQEIVDQHRRCGTSTIQICDRLPDGAHEALRDLLPGVELVQVVHVTGPECLDEAASLDGRIDAVLLDSGNQALAVKELGGTGRTHDWSISRQIVESLDTPVYLAGGLRPDNVNDAIRTVRPFGIDLCSGVRQNGQLDAALLESFMQAVRSSQ